jgi:hypothetical protein
VGDILLKDATSTHRGHYLKYIRDEVLPPDMPLFDLKIRHKDPSGLKIQVLTVRCGRQVATAVAQTLSTFLNGEGTNPEIFISRLALGANRTAHGDHERIYQVHHDFMEDIVYLPFLSSKQIDTPIVEYLESGEQITRTPRQWAKSLVDSDGQSIEVDMENGNTDGDVVLIVPSASLELAKVELHTYWQRQNPMLMNAERFYSASILADPDIPLTVFTKNIDTILAKKIKKQSHPPVSASVLSPDSSITGLTSKTSTTSIAWQVPLQSQMKSAVHSNGPKPKRHNDRHIDPLTTSNRQLEVSQRELAQQHRILSLEAQLATMSTGNSRNSGDKSYLSGNSPNSLATAHARLDGIETAVLNIQSLLQDLSSDNSRHSPASQTSSSKSWPTMPLQQLFSAADPGTQLVVLSPSRSPVASQQKASKRRKALSSPSNLTDHMDSGGESSS